MRAPADFIITRHLLGHPEATPGTLARDLGLHPATAHRVYARIERETALLPATLQHRLVRVAERPHWRSLPLQVPDPETWYRNYEGPAWLSGEIAAEMDGYDLVAERWIVYVPQADLEAATRHVMDRFAKLARPKTCNLTIRSMDPWLRPDPRFELIDTGQRLYDYHDSDHIQLAKALRHA